MASEWRRKENEFIAAIQPTELITIQDELTETSVNERQSYFEKRAFRYSFDVPDDVLQKIMWEARSSLEPERKIQYRRIEQMAVWRLTEQT